jgi:hypothetical protein
VARSRWSRSSYHTALLAGLSLADALPDKQNRPVRLVDTGEPIRELF